MADQTYESATRSRAALAEKLAGLPVEKRKALQSLLESKSAAAKSIPRRDPAAHIPLTYNQERLWIIDQFLTGAAPYNQTNFIRLPFEVNVEIFRRAVNEIVQRHEILRSVIRSVDGEPYQYVHPSLRLDIPLIDLSRRGTAASEAEALELAEEDSKRRLDFETGPLIRASLCKLDTASYLFVLTIHHIACDGWSMGVLAVELSALYWSYALGRPSPLLELPIQYGDFAVWQRKSMSNEVLRPQLAYWRRQLSGLPKIELPADHPRPAQFTFRGARVPLVIDGKLFQSLLALSEKHGVTMHITLLTTLFVLLHKYSSQDDFAIGVPNAGRSRAELEPLIGFFVNTLVIRADLSGNPAFSDLLARVRETSFSAYANGDIPFERLVEELQPIRDPSRNPLVQIMFQLFQPPSSPGIQRENVFSFIAGPAGGAKFDLAFELILHPAEVRGFVEYNSDLFEPERISRLAHHFVYLLEEIAANPDSTLSKLDLMTDEEKRRIVVEWNRTEVDYPRDSNIAAEFLLQAEKNPDHVALEFAGSQMTFGELRERAGAIASALSLRGVSRGDAVGLLMERSLELPAAMLGILWTGAFYVPLDPRYPARRLSYLAEDSGIRQIVTTRALSNRDFDFGGDFLLVEEALPAGRLPLPGIDATDIACLLYTSGTTGEPKGVAINHRNILRLVKNTQYIRLGSDDIMLQFAPITFDASLFEIWGSLLNGARLAIYPVGIPLVEDLAAFIRDSKITVLFLTTSLFRRVVEDSVRDLAHVKEIITGGEVIPVDIAKAAWTHLPRSRILNAYGPTECAVYSTTYELTGADGIGASVPIGRPIANTTAYIVDAYMNPAPIGIPGELLIGGDAVANGYWRRPEATAQRFIANPFGAGTLYRTGDMAQYRADGNIEFLCRRDRQIKLNGYRIELGEVEAALVSHPGVSAAACVVSNPGEAEMHLAAFVEAAPGELLESTTIRAHLEKSLPRFMVPSRIEVLNKLPLTVTGKVDLVALAHSGSTSATGPHEMTAPRTTKEKMLAGIWKSVLHVEDIDIDTDFFALGGQSLLATRLLSRVRDTFRTDVTMAEFFDAPTIRGMAAAIERHEAAPAEQLSNA
jgi:amino acid adenylation domain-containing protein